MMEDYRAAQSEALEDDWRIGKIEEYLQGKPTGSLVCVLQLFREALAPDPDRPQNPSMKDSREIGRIMQQFPDWERCDKTIRVDPYGVQRCWKRISGGTGINDELPF